MKNLIYKWSKSYVDKRDAKVQKIEKEIEAQRRYERQTFDKLINEFKGKYLEEVIDKFKKTISPQFEVGEIVTTNWYKPRSSWDGSMKEMQSHSPFSGPIDVEITAISLDSCEIAEKIEQLKERDEFSNKYTNDSFDTFKHIVDYHRSNPIFNAYDISWQYRIKVPGNDYEYWRYGVRENKLLKRKSNIAKWSRKCYNLELASSKLCDEKKILDEKIVAQKEKIMKNITIVR